MKIAFVYDWMDRWGGAERMLLQLSEACPDADWYTSYVDEDLDWPKKLKPSTSFIQKLPNFIRKSRIMSVPFYPFAFESFNFNGYDVVISITSSYAKSIVTRPETRHISYILSPTRFLWSEDADLYGEGILKKLAKPYLSHLKRWDTVAAQRPDVILTLSQSVQKKIKTVYNRDAHVVHPPFDVQYWKNLKSHIKLSDSEKKKYFLSVSRLEPYKRVEILVDTFNKNGDELIIVGSGSLAAKLKAKAKKNISFMANVPDKELAQLYINAQALIMPQKEDFGYAALEAQYFGCPVIAYGKGGALETIKEDVTGLFFMDQTPASLQTALEKYRQVSYTLQRSTQQHGESQAEQFNTKHFLGNINKYI